MRGENAAKGDFQISGSTWPPDSHASKTPEGAIWGQTTLLRSALAEVQQISGGQIKILKGAPIIEEVSSVRGAGLKPRLHTRRHRSNTSEPLHKRLANWRYSKRYKDTVTPTLNGFNPLEVEYTQGVLFVKKTCSSYEIRSQTLTRAFFKQSKIEVP